MSILPIIGIYLFVSHLIGVVNWHFDKSVVKEDSMLGYVIIQPFLIILFIISIRILSKKNLYFCTSPQCEFGEKTVCKKVKDGKYNFQESNRTSVYTYKPIISNIGLYYRVPNSTTQPFCGVPNDELAKVINLKNQKKSIKSIKRFNL